MASRRQHSAFAAHHMTAMHRTCVIPCPSLSASSLCLTSLLVALNGCGITGQLNDLSDQLEVTHTHLQPQRRAEQRRQGRWRQHGRSSSSSVQMASVHAHSTTARHSIPLVPLRGRVQCGGVGLQQRRRLWATPAKGNDAVRRSFALCLCLSTDELEHSCTGHVVGHHHCSGRAWTRGRQRGNVGRRVSVDEPTELTSEVQRRRRRRAAHCRSAAVFAVPLTRS